MTIQSMAPMLLAADLNETIAFYRDVLGFELSGTFGEPPFWCSLRHGDVQLMFTYDPPHEHAPGEEHDHATPGMTGMLYMYPDDLDELHERLASQWPIAEPIAEQPHGMREFAVDDPSGYRITFGVPV